MNKLKFELKAMRNNIIVKVFKLIKKPLIIRSKNEKQLLKVVGKNSSIINFDKSNYYEVLLQEIDNIIDITGKKAVIL